MKRKPSALILKTPPGSRPSCPRRIEAGGFTLVELLIVIAIILILAALLLPALQGARARARAVICMNNLHDIGVLLSLYEQEYNGYPSRVQPAGACGFFFYGFGGKMGKTLNAWESSCGSDYPADQRPLNRFLNNQGENKKLKLETFHCPSDKGPNQTKSYGGDWDTTGCSDLPLWDCIGTSYMYVAPSPNGPSNGFSGADIGPMYNLLTGQSIRLASLMSPARKILVYESTFHCNINPAVAGSNRHYFKGGTPPNNQGNILFADGSVRYVLRSQGPSGPACSASTAWSINADAPDSTNHDWY